MRIHRILVILAAVAVRHEWMRWSSSSSSIGVVTAFCLLPPNHSPRQHQALLLTSANTANTDLPSFTTTTTAHQHREEGSAGNKDEPSTIGTTSTNTPSRRQFFSTTIMAAATLGTTTTCLTHPLAAHAAEVEKTTTNIPMVTTDEFRILLRDSAQAIRVVEFSGPRSEQVTVQLIDGTAFGIRDVVESSVDPRSPLKIAALCRENAVATKFTTLQAALSKAPSKKKIYSNERVQIAAEKENARRARMAQDEADRLAQLYTYEQEQAAAASVTDAVQK